ncbi:hypothetical protein BpHYR1_033396 [Brachionus plicatilis]|uniref:Uncharacterized protein n=1 Tax=Brachionus plicatilis TaxID=10195 RepID=A0A3M7Q1U5_BRAPC|nr:hypothetical protein BpHYR1_033396 [Brachionus plicatilis]
MDEMVFIVCAKVVFQVVRLQYRTREYGITYVTNNIRLPTIFYCLVQEVYCVFFGYWLTFSLFIYSLFAATKTNVGNDLSFIQSDELKLRTINIFGKKNMLLQLT